MFASRMFLIVLISSGRYCEASRPKRIVNGFRIVGREGPLDVIKYTVGIGDVHNRHWYLFGTYWKILQDTGAYGTVTCGGVVLTPMVIQTTCGCLASFETTKSIYEKKTVINHHWESERVIYAGLNDRLGVENTFLDYSPILSQQFWVSPLCRKLTQNRRGIFLTSYDFGYIKINSDWTLGKTSAPLGNKNVQFVKFAPMYTKLQLRRMYNLFQNTQAVCLIVGFGDTDSKGTASSYIRGGWVLLMNFQECITWTCTDKYGALNWTYDDVRGYKSWVCGSNFPNTDSYPGKGDAGSPLTCNNAYFGLTSANLLINAKKGFLGWKKEFHRRLMAFSNIFQSQFENAVQYRRNFDITMLEFRISKVTYDEVLKRMLKKYGEQFVDHYAAEAADKVVEEIKKEIIGLAERSGKQSRKHSNSNSRSSEVKFTKSFFARRANQGRAIWSSSCKIHVSSVLLVFYPITLSMG